MVLQLKNMNLPGFYATYALVPSSSENYRHRTPENMFSSYIAEAGINEVTMAMRAGGLGINHGCSDDYCDGCRDSGKECCISIHCGWLVCHVDCMCCDVDKSDTVARWG